MQPPAQPWQCLSHEPPPDWFVALVAKFYAERNSAPFAAQLLWQRGIQTQPQVQSFLDPDQYQPTPATAFGDELTRALTRLQQARDRQERVWIWGDFDADGITATAVLWEGLGQFFDRDQQLHYFIPNRLTDSHGLSRHGIQALADQGCQLIVTCDTGSTNVAEIEWAKTLGIDVIVTDHHTLPTQRPPVTAILNPRCFPSDHPLAHLSGVAVAYKLVEALYEQWGDQAQHPLEALLDLVAIGLVADLVQLQGDCRYLTQRGIAVLRQQTALRTRPGVARLLELCKRSGDRPMDIAFGLGPRINAVSRIQGEAHFCVELLTSRDPQRCETLAWETELANDRRKALQKTVKEQVLTKLAQLDLSTVGVIVLSDPQWPVGVLGLVAGEIAQTWGRPTLLLAEDLPAADANTTAMARGSARSAGQIDLYDLVKGQAHLLDRFGGHPFAAGLSLPLQNLPLFTAAINQAIRPQISQLTSPPLTADLRVTVADLAESGGQALFRELGLLEPYGMGNPMPRLWICNCWFESAWHRNLQDVRGRSVQFIRTTFELHDHTTAVGFPGIWWGHYKDELPSGACDALVELDARCLDGRWQYGVRLVAVRPAQAVVSVTPPDVDWIVDWRIAVPEDNPPQVQVLQTCPASWTELNRMLQSAYRTGETVAIAFQAPEGHPPAHYWQQLVGMAKHLVRTQAVVARAGLAQRLGVRSHPLTMGLTALKQCGFSIHLQGERVQFIEFASPAAETTEQQKQAIQQFLAAVQEEQFQQRYFQAVPIDLIQAAGVAVASAASETSSA